MISSDEDGGVKIAIRERPIIQKTSEDPTSVIRYHPTSKNIIVVNDRPYSFDYAFGPTISQQELYDDLVRPLVQKTLQGYCCTVLAYGQTGTGKTFTMGLYAEYFSGDSVGVVARTLKDIFELCDTSGTRPDIAASFVEIYNEKVYDLLGEDTTEQINVKGCKFGGGVKKLITNVQNGLTVLSQGNKCRHIRPTKMNPESSRSHAIFTIHVVKKTEMCEIISSLHLVDLAGSEGVRRTGHQGAALAEGININQGLLTIGKVIKALACKEKVVPYRDSILSSVLQDSLKPSCFLTLLACVSPFREDLSETESTLRFAEYAKPLQHKPQISSILREMKKNKMKTPQKNDQLPLRPSNGPAKTPLRIKRVFSNGSSGLLSTIKKVPYHSNTFCTPNKTKRIEVKKFNQTDLGFTSSAKRKRSLAQCLKSKVKPLALRLPLEELQFKDPNETIDSRSSILSLNVSTSTALDVPITTPILNSYSPIVRRCMMEIENTLETKIEKMFDYMKELHACSKEENMKDPETPKQGNKLLNLNIMPETIRKELKNIVREEIAYLTTITANCNETNFKQDNTSNNDNVDLVPNDLFAESSPIFNVTDQLKTKTGNKTHLLNNETVNSIHIFGEQTDDTIVFKSHQIEITAPDITVMPAKRGRPRGRPLLSTKDNNLNPMRRSMRIERRNSTIIIDNTALDATTRVLSANISKEHRTADRRSLRIEKNNCLMPLVEGVKDTRKPRKYNKNVPISNKIIAGYLTSTNPQLKSTKKGLKDTKQKHENAVLDLLNVGSIKDLQILPQIGLKTAYQIITQRTLNGKFKNFIQVSKLPVWRGNAWERFKMANSIS